MPEKQNGTESDPAEMPSAETLSYSTEDIGLSRRPIDWELSDLKAIEAMSSHERELMILEQNRRIYYAIVYHAKVLSRLVQKGDEETISDETNKLLNPDQYPQTYEEPEVGPPDQPNG